MHDTPSEEGAEKEEGVEQQEGSWEEMVRKIEDLEAKMAEQFEDDNGVSRDKTHDHGTEQANPGRMGATPGNRYTICPMVSTLLGG